MSNREKISLIEETSSDYGATGVLSGAQSTSVSFHSVSYLIQEGVFKKTTKTILNNASGIMLPGLNAIMGPTGSGKTTLLDILADRKNPKGLRGVVLINGERQPKNFKCMSGYVVQDDVVMGTLTVRENFYFSAALRLPLSISWNDKKRRVEKTIVDLGLTDCANTKVGTEFFRGISGGERKRTNIGMELIIEPQVLFLDEPTTGLDAFTAVTVVQLLRNLAHSGNRIIIMSIHQPRYSIYKQCDSLTLLSRGEIVYQGETTKALDYFSGLGYICEEHNNPADFLLDVINKCEGQTSATADLLAIEQNDATDTTVDLANAYVNSNEYNVTQAKCKGLLDTLESKERGDRKHRRFSHAKYATNFLWQLLIVMIRSTINLARDPMTSIIQFVIVIIFGAVVGGLYFQIDNGDNGYQNRIGAIFFIVMNQIFGNLSAIDLFIYQKHIFIHENASGFYRVSAFFLAKVVCDIIPMRLLPLCFFSVIVYFMMGFQVEVVKFFIFFLTLFLTAVAATASAFWVSAGVKVAGVANLLIALIYVIQMLFGGFLLTLDSLPVWIRWLQYGSLFRYSVEALAVNEVEGLIFNQTINDSSLLVPGDVYLDRQGFKTSWLWYDEIGLAVMCLVFLTLTYLTLRIIKKEK